MTDIREDVDQAEATGMTAELVLLVETSLEANDGVAVRALVGDLDRADMADLITALHPDDRTDLINTLGVDLDVEALTELDESVRDQIVEDLTNEKIAELVQELDSDDAVYLLEEMEAEDQSEILAHLPESDRAALRRSLDYPEDSAGRLMNVDVIATPPFWTVGQTIDHMREDDGLPEDFSEIYVVDPAHHLLGVVRLNRLLRTQRPVPIEAIMEEERQTVAVDLDQEEVARMFHRYDLISVPVIDADGRLVGVITADDIVEVINEEAEEDIKRMGGVGDESVSDTVASITRGRFVWLLVNLATAVLASAVIGMFDATIEQMVALAVLMPIVASMGGNAGTQTMTVAVRALATRRLSGLNARRIITREITVGLLNGLMFAAIMAMVTLVWFGSTTLGIVIAAAMVINLLAAGIAGILIPIALEKLGIDPAIASSVFVTTVTDVVGFFAFLGLASIWLL